MTVKAFVLDTNVLLHSAQSIESFQDNDVVIPPLHGALLKNEQDVHLFERLLFMTRGSRRG